VQLCEPRDEGEPNPDPRGVARDRRTLTEGIGHDGRALKQPMARQIYFKKMKDTDIDALPERDDNKALLRELETPKARLDSSLRRRPCQRSTNAGPFSGR
jgi:hypothetical protein